MTTPEPTDGIKVGDVYAVSKRSMSGSYPVRYTVKKLTRRQAVIEDGRGQEHRMWRPDPNTNAHRDKRLSAVGARYPRACYPWADKHTADLREYNLRCEASDLYAAVEELRNQDDDLVKLLPELRALKARMDTLGIKGR